LLLDPVDRGLETLGARIALFARLRLAVGEPGHGVGMTGRQRGGDRALNVERFGLDRRELGAAGVSGLGLGGRGPLHRLGGAEARPAAIATGGAAASSESTHLVAQSRLDLFGLSRIGG